MPCLGSGATCLGSDVGCLGSDMGCLGSDMGCLGSGVTWLVRRVTWLVRRVTWLVRRVGLLARCVGSLARHVGSLARPWYVRRSRRSPRGAWASVASSGGIPKLIAFPLAERLEALRPEVDVLVVTATPTEKRAVLARMAPLPSHQGVLKGAVGPATYYVGRLGAHTIALVMCRMGIRAMGESGSIVVSALRQSRAPETPPRTA